MGVLLRSLFLPSLLVLLEFGLVLLLVEAAKTSGMTHLNQRLPGRPTCLHALERVSYRCAKDCKVF